MRRLFFRGRPFASKSLYFFWDKSTKTAMIFGLLCYPVSERSADRSSHHTLTTRMGWSTSLSKYFWNVMINQLETKTYRLPGYFGSFPSLKPHAVLWTAKGWTVAKSIEKSQQKTILLHLTQSQRNKQTTSMHTLTAHQGSTPPEPPKRQTITEPQRLWNVFLAGFSSFLMASTLD